MRQSARAMIGAMGLALAAAPAGAAEWFVQSGGDGDGSEQSPFGSIQDGLDAAEPGDVVTVRAGSYAESVATVRDGAEDAPITVRGEPGGEEVIVTAEGRVLRVDHAFIAVEALVIDGQYGTRDTVDVNDGADHLVLREVEVRRSSRDCIDMGAPADVLIDSCVVHHCLDATDGRTDAHGITGGPVQRLTLRDTDVHTFSGDAVQFDPGREPPGWDEIRIEGCRFWLEPLPAAANGFVAGAVPGENALDTKLDPAAPRARLTILDTAAWGFRGGMISNMAAFNLKENIDAVLDAVTVFDSEIAFRLRGPGSRGGAWVRVQNALVYDVDVAARYEDDIEQLDMYNVTLGLGVGRPFVAAAADNAGLDVRNLLLLGDTLPGEASAPSNLLVGQDAFVDAAGGDYYLAAGSPAIDAGEAIGEVAADRDGTARPQGSGYDVGAYEWSSAGPPAGGAGGSGAAAGSAATTGGSSGTVGTGGASGTAGGTSGSPSSAGATGAGASGAAPAASPASHGADDEGGCGCRAARAAPPGSTLPWLAVLVWVDRRRRRLSARRSG